MVDRTPEQKSFALYQSLSEQKRLRSDRLTVAAPAERDYSTLPFWLGLGMSVAWIVIVAAVLLGAGESKSFGGVPLINWAIGLSSLTAPIALIWMVTAYLQRASDLQVVANPLRQQLNMILSEQGIAENRVMRFNNALREQVELLRESGQAGEHEIARLLQRLEDEKSAIKKLTKHSTGHVEQAEKIMQAAEQFERLMASNLREVQEVEARLQKHHSGIEASTQDARELLAVLADEIVAGSKHLAQNLAAAKSDGIELRDYLRAQEIDIQNASSNVKDILNKSSRDFTTILDRFHDDATTANSALGKIGDTLAGHATALQQVGTRLPEQLTLAATRLQDAVERYRTLEQTALTTTEATAQRLAGHAQTIDQHFGNFRTSLDANEQQLTQQQAALSTLLDRVGQASTTLNETMAATSVNLVSAADGSLERYRALTQQMQSEAQGMTAKLRDAAHHFETAAAQAAAHTLSQRDNIQSASDQVSRYAMQMDAVDRHTAESARAAREQADETIRAMQQVQDKLARMRDELTTASVQAREQLHFETAAQQQMIGQLTAAAQAGAETLQRTTQSFGAQQQNLTAETHSTENRLQGMLQQLTELQIASERQYNAQLGEMNKLLTSTASQLQAAEQQLKDFGQKSLEPVNAAVAQIKLATQEGAQQIENFAQKLSDRASQVQVLGTNIVNVAVNQVKQATQEGTQQLLEFSARAMDPVNNIVERIKSATATGTDEIAQFSMRAAVPMQHAIDQIKDMTAQGVQQLEEFGQRAQDPIDDIVARIKSATTAGTEQIESFSTHATVPMQQAIDRIKDITAQGVQQLDQFGVNATTPIDDLVARIKSATAAGTDQIAAFSAQMPTPVQQAIDQIKDIMAQGNRHLEQFSAQAPTPMQNVLDQIKDITAQGVQQLEQFGINAMEPIDGILARIKNATTAGTAQIEQFSAQAPAPMQNVLDQIKDITTLGVQQLEQFGINAMEPIDGILARIKSATAAGTDHIEDFSQNVATPVYEAIDAIKQATAQSARQLEMLGADALTPIDLIVDKIAQATSEGAAHIRQFSADAVAPLHDAVAQIKDVTAQGSQQLQDFSQRSLEPVNTAVSRIREATQEGALHIDSFSAKLATAADQVKDIGVSIIDLAEDQTQQIAAAGTRQIKEFSVQSLEPVNDAVARISAVTQQGTQQLKDFSQQSLEPVNTAVARIKEATETSAQHIDTFSAKLADSATQTRTVGDALVTQATDQLERLAAAGAQQLQGFGNRALEPVNIAIGRIKEAAQEGGTHLDDFSTQLAARVTQLQDIGTSIADLTAEQARKIAAAGTQQLQEFSAHAAEPLDAAIARIGAAAQLGTQQLQEFSQQAQAPVDQLVAKIKDATTASATHLDTFSATLADRATQTRDLGADIARIALEQTQKFATAATEQIQGFSAKAQEPIDAAIGRIAEATQQGAKQLQDFSLQAQAPIDHLAGKIRVVTTESGQQLNGFGTQLSDRVAQIQEIASTLATLAADQARKIADVGAQQLQEFSQMAQAPIDQIVVKVREAATESVAQLDKFSAELTDRATLAKDVSTGIAELAIEQTRQIADAAARHVREFSANSDAPVTAALDRVKAATQEGTRQLEEFSANLAARATQVQELSVDIVNTAVTRVKQATEAGTVELDAFSQRIAAPVQAALNQVKSVAAASTRQMDELGLRLVERTEQAQELNAELAAQTLNHFTEATQTSAAHLEGFGAKLAERAAQLHDMGARLTDISTQIDTTSGKSDTTVAMAISKLLSLQQQHELVTQQMQQQIDAATAKMHDEIGALSQKAAQTSADLEQASAAVGTQSKLLSGTAQEATGQMHAASATLLDDAMQLRSSLGQQHETLEAGIAKLQTQLAAAQEAFKQKADTSYSLLDHTGTRFNELTSVLAEEMTQKNGQLHELVLRSMQDASNLGNILHDRLQLIGQGNDQLQSVAGQISGASAKIVSQLQQISEDSTRVSTQFQTHVTENLAQLATVDHSLQQRQDLLATTADTAIATLQRTSDAIGAQNQQLETLADQHHTQAQSLAADIARLGTTSTEVTATLEQNSQRLLAQVQEQISRLQQTDTRLQDNVTQALDSAEQAQSRFGTMTSVSAAQLAARIEELQKLQQNSEQALGAFGHNLQQHLTTLDAAALRIDSANSNIATQLGEMSSGSNQAASLLQENIARHMARFEEVDQNLQYRQQKLSAEAEIAVQTLNYAGEALGTQSSRFAEITAQHSDAAQKIAESIALVSDASSAATTTLEQSSQELLIKLQFNVSQLRQTSDMLQQNVATALVSAEQAHARFDALTEGSAAPLGARVTELQRLHQTTELALSTFAGSIQNQLATLAEIGQQVGEQQRSITITSTTQRDELITLFDRLATAHQASAAAAEQAAARLEDVAQSAQTSLDCFSSGAQNTMGSMRAASTGFAEQAQTILAQSQQSEQQVRSVLAVTSALTEHAKQLREQTQLDATRIGENMAVVVGQLDGSGAKLRAQVEEAIGSLGRGSAVVQDQMQNFLGQINTGNEMMQRQVQGLLSQVGQNQTHLRDELKNHAQSLRDQYGVEATRMSENLQQILAQIEGACGWLRSQTTETMASLDKSAGHFSLATEGAARTLLDQAGKLDETALRLNARLQSLGSALRDEQSTLDHTSAKIEQHAVVMAEQTANATQQLRTLLETMVSGEDQTQSLSRQIAGQMQGVVIHLREELQRLNDYSTTAAKSAHDVAAQIGVHANDLLAATTHIQTQCAQLPQTVDQASQRLSAAGTTLREHASVAADTIDESVAHFIEVTRTNQATLSHNTQALQRAAEEADNTMQTFTRQFGLQLHHLHEGRDIITTEQQKLTEQSMTSLSQLIAASEGMANLRAETSAAHEQLVGQIAYLDDRAQSSSKTLTLNSDAMTQQVRALADAAKKTELQMVVSSDHYRTQLNDMRAALEGNLDAINTGIARTATQLERKSTELRQATDGALQEIDRLVGRFALTAENGTATVEEKTRQLRALAEDTAQLLLGFGTTLDNQLQHMAHAGDMVLKTRDTLAGTIAQSIDQVDSLQHKLEGSRLSAQTSTDQVAMQLQKLGTNLQQHIDRLQTGTQQAVTLVHGASEGWQDQAQNLARVAQQARGELAAISFAMDALLQKGETMRSEVRGQGQDIANTLTHAMEQIEFASDEMGGDDSLVSRIERGLKKIS